jgi:hypothetical protein
MGQGVDGNLRQSELHKYSFMSSKLGEREEFPAKEEWEKFMREDSDVRLVARPSSPFDLQYANEPEADDEIFREGAHAVCGQY